MNKISDHVEVTIHLETAKKAEWIVTIDPHKKKCGYAIYRNRELYDCGIVRTKEEDLVRCAVMMGHELHELVGHFPNLRYLVIEKMRVRKFHVGDPEHLINASIVSGVLIRMLAGHETEVLLPMPDEWKGNANKDVYREEVTRPREPEAQAIMDEKKIAEKTLQPDVWDAIGIAHWTINKLSETE